MFFACSGLVCSKSTYQTIQIYGRVVKLVARPLSMAAF